MDTNEALVDFAVAALTVTFATVFVLGLGVVVALKAKNYLGKAASDRKTDDQLDWERSPYADGRGCGAPDVRELPGDTDAQ